MIVYVCLYASLNRSSDRDETLGNGWTYAREGFCRIVITYCYPENKTLKIGSNRDLISAD